MTLRIVPIVWSPNTLEWVAKCPNCYRTVFSVTAEAVVKGPRRPSGSSELLPVTMSVSHNCNAA